MDYGFREVASGGIPETNDHQNSHATIEERTDLMPDPQCKVFDKGQLEAAKIHRMSRPVVFIGYVLLAPFVIALVIGCLILAFVIVAPLTGNPLPGSDFVVGTVVLVLAGSFVSGLLGWLLVMKWPCCAAPCAERQSTPRKH